MLPWKSIFNISTKSKRPVYLQLVDTLTSEVSSGRIKTGDRLPSSRWLSELLGINRKTVLQAFDELTAQGWIEVIPSKGTFIKRSLPIVNTLPLKAVSIVNKGTPSSAKKIAFDKIINDGTPDYRLAPIDQLYKQARFVAKGSIGKSTLVGDHSKGETHLRKTLSEYLRNTRGISGDVDNVMVTRGSQMSIFLAFSYLLNKGDSVIVGDLNYRTANETITSVGGKLVKVKVDQNGLYIDQIEEVLKKKEIKAVYVTPHHHYPTTVTMPVAHRLRLLELASQYNFHIIEDDYDYDYHYNRSPILPIASIDSESRVTYIGSFSKLLAPSIRIGYMHTSPRIVEACADKRLLIDRRGDPILERALADLITENEISRNLKKTVNIYKARRDLMCQILEHELDGIIRFEKPDGGMALWTKIEGVKIEGLIVEAAKNRLYLDVDTYHLEDCCRLGFASMTETELEDNMELLISSIYKVKK